MPCTDIRKWYILQTDECRYSEESEKPCSAKHVIMRSTGGSARSRTVYTWRQAGEENAVNG